MSRSRPKSQDELDDLMVAEGKDKFHIFTDKCAENQTESHTKHGQRLIGDSLPKLIDSIKEYKEWIKDRSAKAATAMKRFLELDGDMIAYITCRETINCISKPALYSFIARKIGDALDDEIMYRYFRDKDKQLFDRIRTTQGFHATWTQKRLYIIDLMSRKYPEYQMSPLADRMVAGAMLLDMFVKETGFVEVRSYAHRRKIRKEVSATDELIKWIEGFKDYAEILDPVFIPTMDVPLEWTPERSTGAYNPKVASIRMVKNNNRWYQEKCLGQYEFPEVYKSLNGLQACPWQINKDVMNLLVEARRNDIEIPGIPPLDGYDRIPYPEGIDRSTQEFYDLKFQNLSIWKDKQAAISKRAVFSRILLVAERFSHLDQFYFPHSLDFRGRMYPLPNHINPQSSDLGKSLIQFANGEPILHEGDADWLRVAGANRFGFDKATLDERSEWVKERHDQIIGTAKDPWSEDLWREADDPLSFLAFCFEYSSYLEQGYGYVSKIPVNLDASNNGLQILSLLSRDPVGARATNVTDNPSPEDFYQRVCDVAVRRLQEDDSLLSTYWLGYGISRKTVKRSVMILPYSGTQHASCDYIRDWYKEDLKARGKRVPYSEMGAQVRHLNNIVWESIHELVNKPKSVMHWLRLCADSFVRKNLPIMWVTPTGLPILQSYRKQKSTKRIRTILRGDTFQFRLTQDTPRVSASRMKNGISPNVVHSLDAASMQKTISIAMDYGVKNFSMIHDSYGTTAGSVDVLQAATRKAWHEVFKDDYMKTLEFQFNHQLESYRLKVPPPPPVGDLNVKDILDSTYFIS